ncbi:MAG: hypothetical protein LBK56_14410 [Gracilibacteraceae bacterium]|nr:hypothetical protein [Gracilibacteraceae bacterium]
MPSLELLHTPGSKEYIIAQSYLKNDDPNAEERIRMEAGEDGVHYMHTVKIGSGLKRIEKENDITAREFYGFQDRLDYSARPVMKTRYRMPYRNQVIEIDIYPNWDEHAILEVELRSGNDPVHIPDFIEVVKEVTGDKAYSNYSFAFAPLKL